MWESNFLIILKYFFFILSGILLIIISVLISFSDKNWTIITLVISLFIITSLSGYYLQEKIEIKKEKENRIFLEEKISILQNDFADLKSKSLQFYQVDKQKLLNGINEKNDQLEFYKTKLINEYINHAYSMFFSGKLDEAIEYINKVREIKSSNLVFQFLGNIYLLKGEGSLALNIFSEALKYENNFETKLGLANSLFVLGEIDKAISDYLSLIDNYFNPVLFHNLGVAYSRKGEFKKAIFYYRKVINNFPSEIPSLYNLGNLYLKLKNFDSAKRTYDNMFSSDYYKAFGINKDFIYGIYFDEIGKYSEAIKYFKNAISNYHKDFRPYIHLATLLFRLEDYNQSVKVISKCPQKDFRYYGVLGINYHALGKFEKAIINLEHSLLLNPKNIIITSDRLFHSYRELKEYSKAINCLIHAFKNGYRCSTIILNIAQTYEKELNNYIEAKNWYQIEIKTNNTEIAYINYLRLLAKMGDYKEAERIFNISIKFYPLSSQLYNNFGIIKYQNKKIKEAIKYLQKAVELDPNNKNAINNLKMFI